MQAPEPSIEALSPAQKTMRAKIEKRVYEVVQTMDPSGDNTKYWKGFFSKLDDKGFAEFMNLLKEKKAQMFITMPNMKKTLRIGDLLKAAEKVGLKTSQRLWMPDRTSGKKFLTNQKYLILTLPIRRAQQEWDKKLSVPSRDRKVDALTGQVIAEDKGCSLSAPEIQSLNVRGLHNVMSELVRVRGGDVHAYGDFNRQLQENGSAQLSTLDPSTRARSATIAKVLLQSMMLDNNL